jgi:hypothetical protein
MSAGDRTSRPSTRRWSRSRPATDGCCTMAGLIACIASPATVLATHWHRSAIWTHTWCTLRARAALDPSRSTFYGLEDQDVASASTHTWGVRWTPSGTHDAWHWSAALEAAQQHDAGDNPRAVLAWISAPGGKHRPRNLECPRGMGATGRQWHPCPTDAAGDVARLQRMGRRLRDHATCRTRGSVRVGDRCLVPPHLSALRLGTRVA